MATTDIRPTKRCANCRRRFDLIFFPRKGQSADRPRDGERRAICKYCEQNQRDDKKRENPFLAKAYSAIRDHAHRLHFTTEQMRTDFGWIVGLIAHQMERAYGNGCLSCHRLYLSMGHGLADLTVDIRDRNILPFWGHNTWLICNTCNQEKADLSPEDYAILCREWERAQSEPWPDDPQLDLFDSKKLSWEEFKSAPFPGSATPMQQGYLGF